MDVQIDIGVPARERFKAFLNGKYIPPPKVAVALSADDVDYCLEKMAAVLADRYRKDMSDHEL